MARINFALICDEVPVNRLLSILGKPLGKRERSGEYRGACPIHGSGSAKPRSFAVSPDGRKWYCHRCKIGGGVIDLFRELNPGLSQWQAGFRLAHLALGRIPLIVPEERRRGTIQERSEEEKASTPSSGPRPSQAVPDRVDLRQE